MPYNLQCFTTTRQNAPRHSCQAATQDTMGFLSRPSSYDTGAPVPFTHMIQGSPSPCFLTGYRDSCPLSSQDTGIPFPFPHRIQGFLSPSSQDTRIPAPSFRTGEEFLSLSSQWCLSPLFTTYRVSSPHSSQDT
jgi:hypothetical protein